MFCENCGADLGEKEETLFCPNCGHKTGETMIEGIAAPLTHPESPMITHQKELASNKTPRKALLITLAGVAALCVCIILFVNANANCKILVDNGVCYVKEGLFEKKEDLEGRIKIPSNASSIDAGAFSGCKNIDEVVFSSNTYSIGANAFNGCKSLEEVVLPESLQTIGDNAFSGCKKITNIHLSDNIQSIGTGAFSGCSSLSEFTFPDHIYQSVNVMNFKDTPFWDGLPEVTQLQEDINVDLLKKNTDFNDNGYEKLDNYIASLKSSSGQTGVCNGIYYFIGNGEANLLKVFESSPKVEVPQYIRDEEQIYKVTEIFFGAFGWQKGIKEVILPDPIDEIGNSSFTNCEGLEKINLPKHLTEINQGCFSNCSSLNNIIIPDGVESIYAYAFDGCSSLTDITIPESVSMIWLQAFEDTPWKDNMIAKADGCVYINSVLLYGVDEENVEVKDGTTLIAAKAFEDCINLKYINIPSSVDRIHPQAFENCQNLRSISLNVSSIGYKAFSNCSNLDEVKLSDDLTKLGDSAFEDCTSLTSITLPESLGSFSKDVFDGCSNLTRIMISRDLLTKVILPNNIDIVVY